MHRQERHVKAFQLQGVQGMKHRMVLESGRDDMGFAFLLSGKGSGTDGLVIGFGSAGSEINLARLRVNHGSNLFTGLFQDFFGLLTDAVQAGGVSVTIPHTAGHGFNGRLTHGGGRGVIRVNAHSGNSFAYNCFSSMSIIFPFTHRVNRQIKTGRVSGTDVSPGTAAGNRKH